MNNRETIIEAHEKIKKEYLDNKLNPDHNWVDLISKINQLYVIAMNILDEDDLELKNIKNTKKALQNESI